MADRTLVVKLVGDEADLLRAYGKSTKATKDFGRSTDSTLAKTSKRFSAFRSVTAGFAGGIIASTAVDQLRNTINAAAESQRVLTQTRFALEQTGQSWSKYGSIIEDTTEAQSKLGFDDEALLTTFTNFQRVTEDVGKSLKLNNLAMDIARARNIKLEAAAAIVTKALLGQSGALRRIGVDAEKGATSTELLTLLTQKFGGAAQAAAKDSATANERLNVALENIQETIGTALLPVTEKLATQLAETAAEVEAILGGLNRLSKADIPVLNIPVNFELPGTNTKIGGVLRKAFGNLNPITGQTSPIGQVRNVGRLADRLTSGDDAVNKLVRSRLAVAEGIHDRPIVLNTTVTLDEEAVGRNQKKVAQKDKRRNPRQKRGPNQG